MLVEIFRALEKMHKDTGWDPAVGNVFGAIADWLEEHSIMPI